MPELTTQPDPNPASRSFLAGQDISLRSLELSDLDALWHWFADREVVRYSLSVWLFPAARHETQTWLERTPNPRCSRPLRARDRAHLGRFRQRAAAAELFRWAYRLFCDCTHRV